MEKYEVKMKKTFYAVMYDHTVIGGGSKRKRSWCRSRSVESEDRVSGSVAATASDGGLKVPRRVSQIAGPGEGQHHSE